MRFRFVFEIGIDRVGGYQPDVPAMGAGNGEHRETVVLYGHTVRPRRAEHKPRWVPIDVGGERPPVVSAAGGTVGAEATKDEAVDISDVHRRASSQAEATRVTGLVAP